MKFSSRFPLIPILLLVSAALASFAGKSKTNQDLSNFDRKFQRVQTNGARARPDPTPTVFTEQEVNAYLASNEVALPEGVRSVKLEGHPQTVTGRARVDFDRLRAGSGSSNPLLTIFTGIHDVVVATHAYGVGREAHVHVDSVSLDGVEIPLFVLQLFVDKYLHPTYPDIGLDSRFSLPDRIDRATVGERTLTLTQR